jgi:hypothetical protein
VKRFLFQLIILWAAVFFYSCGNMLLDFEGEGNPPGGTTGGGETPVSGTTGVNAPPDAIYIDTQAQFEDCLKSMNFYDTSLGKIKFPLNGYYILRGNGVADRTFTATGPVNTPDSFKGTFTGWYMDESQKTTVKIQSAYGLFLKPLDTATVSWLKFDTLVPVTSPATLPNTNTAAIGIIAPAAKATVFENVTVAGNVKVTADQAKDMYAGGFVGIADATTAFRKCTTGASVSIELASSVHAGYAGGIAGLISGEVQESKAVRITTTGTGYSYENPVDVSSLIKAGSGTAYAGGIAGKLEGKIQTTTVKATVKAAGQSGSAYSGGFAGQVVTNGVLINNTSNTLDVNAISDATADGAFAGGLAGLSEVTLESNSLSNSVSVTAQFNTTGAAYAGGLVGKLSGASTEIKGSSVHSLGSSAKIEAYSIHANVTGKAYAGGLAGFSEGAISDSFFSYSSALYSGSNGGVHAGLSSSTAVDAKEAYAGGIAGYAKKEITKVYVYVASDASEPNTSTSSLAGIDARTSASDGIAAAGGIAGKSEAAISESYAVVTVKARAGTITASPPGEAGASAGGISGISSANITDTFALAQVDARPLDSTIPAMKVQAGGIAGYLSGTAVITSSYAAGSVMAIFVASKAQAGGIAGDMASSATPAITRCVAVQRYVSCNGGDNYRHRVAGYLGVSPSASMITTTYAYSQMTVGIGLEPIPSTSSYNEHGTDMSATDAVNLGFYTNGTAPGWDSGKWMSGGTTYNPSFPVLTALPLPSVPSWATLP